MSVSCQSAVLVVEIVKSAKAIKKTKITEKQNFLSFIEDGNSEQEIVVCYNPNKTSVGFLAPNSIRSGFSSISFTFTKKPTDSRPSIKR